MSEGVQASPELSNKNKKIRNPRDFYGGLTLAAFGAFALWASQDLPGMHGFAFGPGTGPRIFAITLIVLSLGVALVGYFTDGPALERYEISGPALITLSYLFAVSGNSSTTVMIAAALAILGVLLSVWGLFSSRAHLVRGPFFITVAIIVFAVTIRSLGLVIASYLSIIASSAATPEVRWLETIIWGAILTAFCVVLFPIALNLPLQLWPTPGLSWSSLLSLR